MHALQTPGVLCNKTPIHYPDSGRMAAKVKSLGENKHVTDFND
jgi:hypothetical protein